VPEQQLDPKAIVGNIDQLDNGQLHVLLRDAFSQSNWAVCIAAGSAMLARNACHGASGIRYVNALAAVGRSKEAGRAYLDILQRGGPVLDYRPRFDASSLASAKPDYARALRKAELEKAGLIESQVVVWRPVVSDGSVTLRGASATRMAGMQFELSPLGTGEITRVAAVVRSGDPSGTAHYEGRVSGLAVGVYRCRLVAEDGQAASDNEVEVVVPAFTPTTVATTYGEVVAPHNVVMCGIIRTQSRGARYRFEYGAAADQLDKATAWQS